MADFIAILSDMFVPGFATKLVYITGPAIGMAKQVGFLLLGVLLIVLTLKNKVSGSLKKFLLLSGGAAAGFFVFVLLHNLVSGLLSTLFDKPIEEPVFFLLATLVCPLGFLIGAIGTILNKRN